MVSAKLSYRKDSPSDVDIKELFNIAFSGNTDVTDELYVLRDLIQYDKSKEVQVKIDNLRKHEQDNYCEWLKLQKQIKDFKKKHLFWMLSKELRGEMSVLDKKSGNFAAIDEHLRLVIDQLELNRAYSVSELTAKFKNLLSQLGFVFRTSEQGENDIHQETFESTCSDEELLTRVRKILKETQKEQKESREKIDGTFKSPEIIYSDDVLQSR